MVVHDTPSRFMTADEAGALLRISPRTVRKLLRDHQIPGVRIGGQYRVDIDALDAHCRINPKSGRNR